MKIAIALFLVFFAAALPAQAAPAKKHILMLLTSHDELYDTGKKTGFWFDELATPYYIFTDAGIDVSLFSILGDEPPADPRSMEQKTAAVRRFLKDKAAMEKLSHTGIMQEAKADDFDGIFLVGGHGALWDFTENSYLKMLLEQLIKDKKIIAAIDHGTAGLLTVKTPDGKTFIDGRKLATFTKAEEEKQSLQTIVPFYTDMSLEKEGAHIARAAPFTPNVVRDKNLITGQNPESSAQVAKLTLQALTQPK